MSCLITNLTNQISLSSRGWSQVRPWNQALMVVLRSN